MICAALEFSGFSISQSRVTISPDAFSTTSFGLVGEVPRLWMSRSGEGTSKAISFGIFGEVIKVICMDVIGDPFLMVGVSWRSSPPWSLLLVESSLFIVGTHPRRDAGVLPSLLAVVVQEHLHGARRVPSPLPAFTGGFKQWILLKGVLGWLRHLLYFERHGRPSRRVRRLGSSCRRSGSVPGAPCPRSCHYFPL